MLIAHVSGSVAASVFTHHLLLNIDNTSMVFPILTTAVGRSGRLNIIPPLYLSKLVVCMAAWAAAWLVLQMQCYCVGRFRRYSAMYDVIKKALQKERLPSISIRSHLG